MNHINNLIFKASVTNTRILQESQHINFLHSPQNFVDHSNSSQSSIISHSPLLLSPIQSPIQSTSNEMQMFPTFSNNSISNDTNIC